LAQTQAELSGYDWRTWEIQDALRRSPKIDLTPAITQYKIALTIDPRNATANRRLGQIELSRGDYDSARNHLESAYAAASDQRATRQLLGEVYAISGDADRAVELWKAIDVSDGQLQYRIWWYEHLGDLERAKNLKLAAQRLGK
jgi:tetratricopeptide (TPR) repeat protein